MTDDKMNGDSEPYPAIFGRADHTLAKLSVSRSERNTRTHSVQTSITHNLTAVKRMTSIFGPMLSGFCLRRRVGVTC